MAIQLKTSTKVLVAVVITGALIVAIGSLRENQEDWEFQVPIKGHTPQGTILWRAQEWAISRAVVTDRLPVPGVCTQPLSHSDFTVDDTDVWVWLEVKGQIAGEVAQAVWVSPSNRTVASDVIGPARKNGQDCYAVRLKIKSGPGAMTPGNWAVRILKEDVDVGTPIYFRIW